MATGTDGDDYIVNADLENHGFGGNDLIISHAISGNVLFYGEAGNDYVQLNFSGTASGYLYGGSGTDWLTGSVGDDHLVGDEGNDLLMGGASETDATGNDVLTGGNGTNGLYGYDGDDVLYGGVNDDGPGAAYPDGRVTISYYINQSTIFQAGLYGGDGNDTLDGGAGADLMVGGTGDDLYYVDNSSDQVIENADEGYDTIVVSVGQFFMTQSMAAVERVEAITEVAPIALFGNTFDNVLVGNAGDNYLDGGDGNDTLIGGDGGDALLGNGGADILEGGGGNDRYYVDKNDTLRAETQDNGTDRVIASLSYTLPDNFEELELTGSGNISGSGNALANFVLGSDGNNTLDGGAGADQLNGRLGDDTYIVDNADDMVYEADDFGVGGGNDTVKASVSYILNGYIENLVLTGNDDNNGTGNEIANIITGNSGSDTLTGNAGNDTLDGKGGEDMLIGGLGNDTYIVDNLKDIVQEAPDEGTDTVRASVKYMLGGSIEKLILTGSGSVNGTGTALANTLTGNDSANRLSGGGGNDTLIGGDGADRLVGGDGSDTVSFLGSAKRVTASLFDRSLNTNDAEGDSYSSIENLTGSAHADKLYGNASANTISGGKGIDKLYGGSGADIFVFAATESGKTKASSDTIYDFASADTINLHEMDADTKMSGNNDFAFIGAKSFTRHAGELRYEKASSDTWISGDTNGDGKSDFIIHLDDAVTMKAGYFDI